MVEPSKDKSLRGLIFPSEHVPSAEALLWQTSRFKCSPDCPNCKNRMFGYDAGRASRDVDAEVAALKAVTDRDAEIARLKEGGRARLDWQIKECFKLNDENNSLKKRVNALETVAEASFKMLKNPWVRMMLNGLDGVQEFKDALAALGALDSETKEAKKK